MRKFKLSLLLPLSGAGLLMLAAWQGGAQSPPGPGNPLPGLTPDQQILFVEGRDVFASAEEADEGLGPVFNGVSCGECHLQGALGGAGNDLLQTRVTRIGGVRNGVYSDLADVGGPVLQRRSVKEFSPECPIEPESVPTAAQFVSHRITTPLFGAGLIEAIPEPLLLAFADPDDRNHDGISGRPNYQINPETGRREIGRFGWKSQVSTLHFFAGDAYLNEMGITSATFPAENLPQGLPIPEGWDPVPDPEEETTTPNDVDRFANFMRFLAPPPSRALNAQGVRGAALFVGIQCASCHLPVLLTGPNAVQALAFKPVRLFSDLLVHDMGVGLGDGVRQGEASGSEFRTAPLWGLSLRKFFLHDGRAATITDAILAHGGEAQRARNGFRSLGVAQKADLLAFLNTL